MASFSKNRSRHSDSRPSLFYLFLLYRSMRGNENDSLSCGWERERRRVRRVKRSPATAEEKKGEGIPQQQSQSPDFLKWQKFGKGWVGWLAGQQPRRVQCVGDVNTKRAAPAKATTSTALFSATLRFPN